MFSGTIFNFAIKKVSTVIFYNVNLYAIIDSGNPPTNGAIFYTSVDGTNYNPLGSSFSSTTCTLRASTSISSGTVLYIKILDSVDLTDLFFNFATSASCPATVGTSTLYSFTVNSTVSRAFRVQSAA